MSGTRRVPLARRSAAQITPAAMEAFRRIRSLEAQCTCLPRDWEGEYWKHEPCPACGRVVDTAGDFLPGAFAEALALASGRTPASGEPLSQALGSRRLVAPQRGGAGVVAFTR